MSSRNKIKMAAFYSAVIFLFIIDRLIKFLAVNNFFTPPLNILGNFFKLNFIPNYYISFSLPVGGLVISVLVFIIIIGLLFTLINFYKKKDYKYVLLLIVIILGAISNLADRIKYGFVIDYFDLKYFTVFNVADIMIVFGIISIFFVIKKQSLI